MKSVARFFKFAVICPLILNASISYAYPSLKQFEIEVAKIFETKPQKLETIFSYEDLILAEKSIDALIQIGDKSPQLGNQAYELAIKYLQANHIQEAIWQLKQAGLITYGNFLENFMIKAMKQSEVTWLPGASFDHPRGSSGKIELSPNRSVDVIVYSGDTDSHGRSNVEAAVEADRDAFTLDRILNLNLAPVVTEKPLVWSGDGKEYFHSIQLVVTDIRYSGLDLRLGKKDYSEAQSPLYLFDYAIGNVDRSGTSTALSTTHKLYALRSTRTLAHGVISPIRYGVLMGGNYIRSTIHDLPFESGRQYSYITEQTIRNMSIEDFQAKLQLQGVYPKAIAYYVRSFEKIKSAVLSRPTQAKPISVNRTPYESNGLLEGSLNSVLLRQRIEKAEKARLKAQAENLAAEKEKAFFAEQDQIMREKLAALPPITSCKRMLGK